MKASLYRRPKKSRCFRFQRTFKFNLLTEVHQRSLRITWLPNRADERQAGPVVSAPAATGRRGRQQMPAPWRSPSILLPVSNKEMYCGFVVARHISLILAESSR